VPRTVNVVFRCASLSQNKCVFNVFLKFFITIITNDIILMLLREKKCTSLKLYSIFSSNFHLVS